jgi:hypothetical protein
VAGRHTGTVRDECAVGTDRCGFFRVALEAAISARGGLVRLRGNFSWTFGAARFAWTHLYGEQSAVICLDRGRAALDQGMLALAWSGSAGDPRGGCSVEGILTAHAASRFQARRTRFWGPARRGGVHGLRRVARRGDRGPQEEGGHGAPHDRAPLPSRRGPLKPAPQKPARAWHPRLGGGPRRPDQRAGPCPAGRR